LFVVWRKNSHWHCWRPPLGRIFSLTGYKHFHNFFFFFMLSWFLSDTVWTTWFGGEEPMDFDGREVDLIFVEIQLWFVKASSGDQTIVHTLWFFPVEYGNQGGNVFPMHLCFCSRNYQLSHLLIKKKKKPTQSFSSLIIFIPHKSWTKLHSLLPYTNFAPVCFTNMVNRCSIFVYILANRMLLPQYKFQLENKWQYSELHISVFPLFIFPLSLLHNPLWNIIDGFRPKDAFSGLLCYVMREQTIMCFCIIPFVVSYWLVLSSFCKWLLTLTKVFNCYDKLILFSSFAWH